MGSNNKICPQCQHVNASMNLACISCDNSLIHVQSSESWTQKYEKEGFERNYFFEELFTPTFLVCIPTALLSAFLAMTLMGSSLMVPFFALAVLLAGIPFMPGDPVGNYLREQIEAYLRKQKQ